MEAIAQQQIEVSLCITMLYLVLFCGSIVYAGNRLENNSHGMIAPLDSSAHERVMYLDLLRIFSAFSVIFLHVNATRMNIVPVSDYRYAVFIAFAVLSRYCVPIFLMISGVFFLDNSRPLPLKKLFCHNIKHIVSALLLWSFVYATYMSVYRILYTNKPIAFDPFVFIRMVITGEYGYSHLQFMFYIIGCYLLVPFMRQISEKRNYVLYYLGLAIIFGFGLNTMQQFVHWGGDN